jgi:molybdopterin-biosynthesis enzyme MoeA-like protein
MGTTEDDLSKEKAASYWYNQGYRGEALHRKIEETMEQGRLVDDSYITCAGGVCD